MRSFALSRVFRRFAFFRLITVLFHSICTFSDDFLVLSWTSAVFLGFEYCAVHHLTCCVSARLSVCSYALSSQRQTVFFFIPRTSRPPHRRSSLPLSSFSTIFPRFCVSSLRVVSRFTAIFLAYVYLSLCTLPEAHFCLQTLCWNKRKNSPCELTDED